MRLIVAIDSKNGIGKNNSIPWKIKEDLQFFKKMTSGGTVIIGRKTWESLPVKPLPNRTNIVLSGSNGIPEDIPDAWIIGGSSVYRQVLENNLITEMYVTRVNEDYDCDKFFPEIDINLWKEEEIIVSELFKISKFTLLK